MIPFLRQVAETCYKKYGNEISDYTFVFQSRRAAKFFQKYLSDTAQCTLFSPTLITIGDLIRQESKLVVADRIYMLLKIHKIYNDVLHSDESFDNFAYWGEMLINDFDDVDKYLVDAKQLFTNLKDLKEIENKFNYLSETQIEAIKTFWCNWNGEKKGEKDFINIWEHLYEIYQKFNTELRNKNLAYEGMIYREVAERAKNNESLFENHKKIIFVGLNALTECEYKIYSNLKKSHDVDFYWDYASPDTTNQSNRASHFHTKNTKLFPSELHLDYDETPQTKNIHIIEMASTVGQAKQIGDILQNMNTSAISKDLSTAVVLPDEGLLLPLLYSLPKEIDNVNITMGYPLSKTPLASLIDYIFSLHINARKKANGTFFYHRDATAILSHQYIVERCEDAQRLLNDIHQENKIYIENFDTQNTLITKIFNEKPQIAHFIDYLLDILELLKPVQEEKKESDKMQQEFVYHYLITLKRLKDLLAESDIQLKTLHRFIRQFINSISIPFEGEPLKGLQIMGVLETRNLDFDTIIIPCMNEGIFPKISTGNSFIPHNLRYGFGMPTGEHIDSVFAYHFYRLIFRAKNIYFLYNSSADGLQTGEESRYILQLTYSGDKNLNISRKNITFDITKNETDEIVVNKTENVLKQLDMFINGDKKLSASSISTYLNCPLKFYLQEVKRLRDTDDVKETMDKAGFGNVFHKTMQLLYSGYENKEITSNFCERLLNEKNIQTIENTLKEAYKEVYKIKNGELEGQPLLTLHIVKQFVIAMLKYDKLHAPFTYKASEFEFKDLIVPLSDGRPAHLKGYIDRIDEKEGRTRIIDYKTGKNDSKLEFDNIPALFESESKKSRKEIMQILLYSLYFVKNKNVPAENLVQQIIYVQDLLNKKADYQKDSNLVINKSQFSFNQEICKEFEQELRKCLDEIFNPEKTFSQTNDDKNCKYCNFKDICERNDTD